MKLSHSEFMKYLPLLRILAKSQIWADIDGPNMQFCKICCKTFPYGSSEDVRLHGTIHIEENKHLIPFM